MFGGWTTRVASGPRAVGVPRPPRAGRGRGRRYRAGGTSSRYVTPPKSDCYSDSYYGFASRRT
eukprot:scaffold118179_cov78-Phaeocystis_antarctica.AAC.2